MIPSILLQAGTGNYQFFIMLGLMFVIMYFFMIRPQQKKASEAKKYIAEVKKGDSIVTIGGMHGRIAEMEGETFILEAEKGARMRFNKTSISMEASKAANK